MFAYVVSIHLLYIITKDTPFHINIILLLRFYYDLKKVFKMYEQMTHSCTYMHHTYIPVLFWFVIELLLLVIVCSSRLFRNFS